MEKETSLIILSCGREEYRFQDFLYSLILSMQISVFVL